MAADQTPPFRIVRPSDPLPRRSRRPGVAVVLILLYAGIFGAGLWWLKSASPLLKGRGKASDGGPRPAKTPAASPRPSAQDAYARRAALLSGEGLAPEARKEYVRRIAAEKCTCGCEETVQACLARDQTCSRSAAMAQKIRGSLP
jgi:hypothetical protein